MRLWSSASMAAASSPGPKGSSVARVDIAPEVAVEQALDDVQCCSSVRPVAHLRRAQQPAGRSPGLRSRCVMVLSGRRGPGGVSYAD